HLPFPYDGAMYGSEPETAGAGRTAESVCRGDRRNAGACAAAGSRPGIPDGLRTSSAPESNRTRSIFYGGAAFLCFAGNVSGLHGIPAQQKIPAAGADGRNPWKTKRQKTGKNPFGRRILPAGRRAPETGSYHRVGEIP